MNKKPILWVTDTAGGNYMEKLLPIGLALPRGTLWDVTCHHDDWCGIHDGRRCNCDPEVVIVPLDL